MNEKEYNERVTANIQAIIDAISAIPCRYPGRDAYPVVVEEQDTLSARRKIYVDFLDGTEVIIVKLS